MSIKEARTLKVIGYARVSTLLGQDAGLQITNLKQAASVRGYEWVGSYIDQGISGAKERRPQLDQLLRDARLGKFNAVMVVGIDRISRSLKHLLVLVDELKDLGVGLISLREAIGNTPQDRAFMQMVGIISEMERSLISERIKSSLAARKLADKNWTCGRPRLAEEKVIQIKELRERGFSIRRIAKELNLGKTSVERVVRGRR